MVMEIRRTRIRVSRNPIFFYYHSLRWATISQDFSSFSFPSTKFEQGIAEHKIIIIILPFFSIFERFKVLVNFRVFLNVILQALTFKSSFTLRPNSMGSQRFFQIRLLLIIN